MVDIKKVLTKNWFICKWNFCERDDWIIINLIKDILIWEDWDNEPLKYEFKNKNELVWFLVLRNIINRLF